MKRKMLFDSLKTRSDFIFNNPILEELLKSTSIVSVLETEYKICLKLQGKEYVCNCPFPNHRDSTPSFSVNNEKGLFYCYGCGVGGNLITFIQLIEGLSFPETLLKISQITGVKIGGDNEEASVSYSIRQFDRMTQEYINRSYETDLPAGMSNDQFMIMLAKRLREYEKKSNMDENEILWVETIYKEADRLDELNDQIGLSKLWNEIQEEIHNRYSLFKKKGN